MLIVYCTPKYAFNYMKNYLLTILFFFLFFCLTSCRDEYSICNLGKDVKFFAGFYQKIAGNEVTATAPNLTIALLNTSNPIYNNEANVTVFSLPLNGTVDSAKYVITIANNLPKDTLTIVYTSQSNIISAECGSAIYNNVTKLYSTYNTIDSVKIILPAVNTSLLQNAKIYF